VVTIANVHIPKRKRLVIALTYIYGIGNSLAMQVCKDSGVSTDVSPDSLNESELVNVRNVIKKLTVEGDLRKEVNLNIKQKRDIKCYQGLRHSRKMPVRGQNTRSNARTRKGKALTIAGKKKATDKK
jgi:small subunit ribosomal protein S13